MNMLLADAAAGQSASVVPPGRRQQSRKKMIADEAAYRGIVNMAAPSVGAKRTAADRADGEPRKRKRVDHTISLQAQAMIASATIAAKQGQAKAGEGDVSGSASLFEFSKLPSSALYRYLMQHGLVPAIYPSPLSVEDPPPPSYLLDPAKWGVQRAANTSGTPANRPRRHKDGVREASAPQAALDRRRSTRGSGEDVRAFAEQVPVLADVGEVHNVLAQIAQKHYRESNMKEMEVETLASFMCAVKAKQGGWR